MSTLAAVMRAAGTTHQFRHDQRAQNADDDNHHHDFYEGKAALQAA